MFLLHNKLIKLLHPKYLTLNSKDFRLIRVEKLANYDILDI